MVSKAPAPVVGVSAVVSKLVPVKLVVALSLPVNSPLAHSSTVELHAGPLTAVRVKCLLRRVTRSLRSPR
jgi:hypothetical protein